MAKGRAVAVILDAAETAALTALIRKHGAPQSLALRARIVLAAAEGLTNKEIAMHLNACAYTVGVRRNRFSRDSLDRLYDEPRPGTPRQIGDDEIAKSKRLIEGSLYYRCGPTSPSGTPTTISGA